MGDDALQGGGRRAPVARAQRPDRVSRADLEKAQDGRVGAQIRIVIGGRQSERRRKGEDQPEGDDPKQGSDLLDRLGY